MLHLPTHTSFPALHGHRGCRGLFPENTIPAFLHALTMGVEVLEMDVVISADKQVVVAHEPWLPAHLGLSPQGSVIDPGQERAYNIYQLPYATIRQCEVGSLPYGLFPSQQFVPTYRPLLHEVLQTVENICQQLGRFPVGYSIEIKSDPATDNTYHPAPNEFVELVASVISPVLRPRVTLLSFDHRILQVSRQLMPTLAVCLLVETPFQVSTLFQELGFVPEVFGPDYHLITPTQLRELKISFPKLRVVCWTVNTLADMRELSEWGIAAITTDYPDRFLQA